VVAFSRLQSRLRRDRLRKEFSQKKIRQLSTAPHYEFVSYGCCTYGSEVLPLAIYTRHLPLKQPPVVERIQALALVSPTHDRFSVEGLFLPQFSPNQFVSISGPAFFLVPFNV